MGRLYTLAARKVAALAVVAIGSLSLAGYWLLRDRTPKPPARATPRILAGFTAPPLPVALPNVNCVRYHADGRLFVGTFSGKIYTLRDRDGDGLEETVATFWAFQLKTITGMALTPPARLTARASSSPRWVRFCSCSTPIATAVATSRLLPLSPGSRCGSPVAAVDAVGLAVDRDGAVYFGWHFRFSEPVPACRRSGTLQPAGRAMHGSTPAPDLKSRATLATGLRFTVGMNINRHGDLFCTDQEGATWIANGNAFDELLHLQPDRHYGFPPGAPRTSARRDRRAEHIGLRPAASMHVRTLFQPASPTAQPCGPPSWQGNAIVTGESRGKLFRTSLVKTPDGYVARNQVLACLAALPVDVCVSPAGELVVACHGGDPDWGSGPAGIGALVKIRYVDRHMPQPVVAWRESPTEFRVAFDRPLERE